MAGSAFENREKVRIRVPTMEYDWYIQFQCQIELIIQCNSLLFRSRVIPVIVQADLTECHDFWVSKHLSDILQDPRTVSLNIGWMPTDDGVDRFKLIRKLQRGLARFRVTPDCEQSGDSVLPCLCNRGGRVWKLVRKIYMTVGIDQH